MQDDRSSYFDTFVTPLPVAAPVATPIERPSLLGYAAWGKAVENSTMLEVRQRPGPGMREQGEILPLYWLIRATYTVSAQTEIITLSFSDCIVTATGRNLAGLRPALMAGQVDFLQEFTGEGTPPAGQPVITALRVQERDQG